MDGWIFDIKKFSIHDGPGIRTTVFLKGCPLNCFWCQNPEGIAAGPVVWHNKKICSWCFHCVEVCEPAAIIADSTIPEIKIDQHKCTLCGVCVAECPTEAITFTGRKTSVQKVVDEVFKDRLFYEISDGGITLSGGEPLYQASFAIEILKRCKKEGIHTAVETSLFGDQQDISALNQWVDLWIVDQKIWEEELHESFTGVEPGVVRSNLIFLNELTKDILVRIPVIPGFTDHIESIYKIKQFVKSVNPDIPIELINFNPYMKSKYERMGWTYKLNKDAEPLKSHEFEHLKKLLDQ